MVLLRVLTDRCDRYQLQYLNPVASADWSGAEPSRCLRCEDQGTAVPAQSSAHLRRPLTRPQVGLRLESDPRADAQPSLTAAWNGPWKLPGRQPAGSAGEPSRPTCSDTNWSTA